MGRNCEPAQVTVVSTDIAKKNATPRGAGK